jgi:DNA-directed RNA polymerase specialized sigma24 family protein
MARDLDKDAGHGRSSAAVRQNGLEDPAAFPRMAILVRAAQAGDVAALDAVVAVLTPTVLHILRALWGSKRHDVESMTRDVLVSIITALPSWRGECTLLHFATRIAARRAVAAAPPPPRGLFARLGWQKRTRWVSATPWDEEVADRRRALLRTFFGELPEDQGEAMVLRLALGYSLQEIALISSTSMAVVRSRLRLAKEALRARIEADPDWDEVWGDDA